MFNYFLSPLSPPPSGIEHFLAINIKKMWPKLCALFCSDPFRKIIPRRFLFFLQQLWGSTLLFCFVFFCLQKTSAAYFTGMTPRSLLLCALVLLSFFITVWTSPVCVNKCCRFVEDFPVRLKTLRLNYAEIRDFYVSKCNSIHFACKPPRGWLVVGAASFG